MTVHASEIPPPLTTSRPPPSASEFDRISAEFPKPAPLPRVVHAPVRSVPSAQNERKPLRRARFSVDLLVVRAGESATHFRASSATFAIGGLVWSIALALSFAIGWVGHGFAAMPDVVGVLATDARLASGRSLRTAFSFAPASNEPSVVARAQARADELGLGTIPAANELIGGRPRPEWVEAAGTEDDVVDTLRWPVPRGWFVRGYGSGEGGYHRAVDVAGEIGSDVVAAAGGIVGYAGDQVRGYGNLILIVHPGGWVTMYAHNSRNLVTAGQRVEVGQLIGRVGSTGISRGPHVHFELRYRGYNCDPSPLFRPAILHRNGEPSVLTPARWSPLERPPRAIECGRRRRHPGYPRENGSTAHAHVH